MKDAKREDLPSRIRFWPLQCSDEVAGSICIIRNETDLKFGSAIGRGRDRRAESRINQTSYEKNNISGLTPPAYPRRQTLYPHVEYFPPYLFLILTTFAL